MRLLVGYLKGYWKLVLLTLLLAAMNQVFSLLDPLIFRHVIDQYATKYDQYTRAEFFKGVSLLLGAAVGVAFVSRVAKNFQDYFLNVITQKLGAQVYSRQFEQISGSQITLDVSTWPEGQYMFSVQADGVSERIVKKAVVLRGN